MTTKAPLGDFENDFNFTDAEVMGSAKSDGFRRESFESNPDMRSDLVQLDGVELQLQY